MIYILEISEFFNSVQIYYIIKSSSVTRTSLNLDNPGLNPLLSRTISQCVLVYVALMSNLGQVCSLYLGPVHSAFVMSTWL